MTMHGAPHPKSDIKRLCMSRATRTVCGTLGTVMAGS